MHAVVAPAPMAPQLFFSRYEDGARPVMVYDDADGERCYTLEDYQGGKAMFTTARSLLVALTGHPTGRNWTLDRYFRKRPEPESNVFDLFPAGDAPVTEARVLAPLLDTSLTVEPRTVVASTFKSSVLVVDTSPPLGIDLNLRGHEVAKLFYAGFGSKVARMGFEADDVLQEVYRGLLARNDGVCPFDARKSSFGHYVHMVIRCVLSNYRRKQFRIREVEQVGMVSVDDKEAVRMDAKTWAADHATASPSLERSEWELHEAQRDLVNYLHAQGDPDAAIMEAALPLMQEGMSRKEIATVLGVSRTTLARAVRTLKELATTWAYS
jgi:RNA polymerase sigma factor (sigma-70 family)